MEAVRCAVVGNPISHSLSPIIHQEFAKQVGINLTYEKMLGDEEQFEQQVMNFFATNNAVGLNITLPFKSRAYEMANVCSSRASLAKAANTLWYYEGRLHADNTDGIGLVNDLLRYHSLINARILILGAGGAARGIIPSLLTKAPAQIVVANRSSSSLEKLKQDISTVSTVLWQELSGEFDIILNATSAGTLGTDMQLPPNLIKETTLCYDLSYKYQSDTPFVEYAKQYGCLVLDGLGMLVEQAAESFTIWHGIKPSAQAVLAQLRNQ